MPKDIAVDVEEHTCVSCSCGENCLITRVELWEVDPVTKFVVVNRTMDPSDPEFLDDRLYPVLRKWVRGDREAHIYLSCGGCTIMVQMDN